MIFRPARGNKYGARRTWSMLCERWFASAAEAERGEQLALLAKAGDIQDLRYQPRFVLSEQPRVTYTADFSYRWTGQADLVVADVKGILSDGTRVRVAWLLQRHGIRVTLLRRTAPGRFEEIVWS